MATQTDAAPETGREDATMADLVLPMVERYAEQGSPQFAVSVLGLALAHDVAASDHADPGDSDDPIAGIDTAFGGEGTPYAMIHDAVTSLDTDTKLALIEGNEDFYSEYGFEGDHRNPHDLIDVTATHCVREIVWGLIHQMHGFDTDRTEMHDLL